MENLKPFTHVTESEQSEKTEKIQVLLSKEALAKGEAPVSVSHYVRKLIRKNLGKTTTD